MRYAVAVTLTKPIINGTNIVTSLNLYDATSHAEAKGLAYDAASSRNPEHQVFSVAIVEAPLASSSSPVPEHTGEAPSLPIYASETHKDRNSTEEAPGGHSHD